MRLLLALLMTLSAGMARADAMSDALTAYADGNLVAAAAGFKALSARKIPLADYNLAMMHLRGEVPKPNEREAQRLLERAAAKGFVSAMFSLAQFHEQNRRLPLAVRWYAKAAEGGSVDAQEALATAYYLGRGVARDYAQAARWYREAAAGGELGSQYILASMYETGLGVPVDLRLARYWYEVAAKNGDEAAPAKLRELEAREAAAREQL